MQDVQVKYNAVGTASAQPKSGSMIGDAGDAISHLEDRLNDLAKRVSVAHEDLHGPIPDQVGNVTQNLPPHPPGLLGTLGGNINRLELTVSRLETKINDLLGPL